MFQLKLDGQAKLGSDGFAALLARYPSDALLLHGVYQPQGCLARAAANVAQHFGLAQGAVGLHHKRDNSGALYVLIAGLYRVDNPPIDVLQQSLVGTLFTRNQRAVGVLTTRKSGCFLRHSEDGGIGCRLGRHVRTKEPGY